MIKQKLSPADFDVEYNPSETLSLIIGSALLRISIKAPAKPKPAVIINPAKAESMNPGDKALAIIVTKMMMTIQVMKALIMCVFGRLL